MESANAFELVFQTLKKAIINFDEAKLSCENTIRAKNLIVAVWKNKVRVHVITFNERGRIVCLVIRFLNKAYEIWQEER